MKLWLITRLDRVDYDETRGMVIRAESAADAVKVFAEKASVDVRAARVRIVPLREDGEPGVVLKDFNAG